MQADPKAFGREMNVDGGPDFAVPWSGNFADPLVATVTQDPFMAGRIGETHRATLAVRSAILVQSIKLGFRDEKSGSPVGEHRKRQVCWLEGKLLLSTKTGIPRPT